MTKHANNDLLTATKAASESRQAVKDAIDAHVSNLNALLKVIDTEGGMDMDHRDDTSTEIALMLHNKTGF